MNQGCFLRALAAQPFMTIAIVLALLYMAYSFVVVLLRLPRLRMEGDTKKLALLLTAILIAAAVTNWFYILYQGR